MVEKKDILFKLDTLWEIKLKKESQKKGNIFFNQNATNYHLKGKK